MAGVAVVEERAVARPLKVLVPLIKEDFEKAEQAGVSRYTAAGEKLNEAREGHFDGNTTGFYEWAEKTFRKSRTQIRTYLAWGSQSSHKSFKNLEQFRIAPKTQGGEGRPRSRLDRTWTAPVDQVAQRARQEQFRLAQEDALTRAQEREAERKLAHRLIDIGYKVLAKELHPDKLHGDKDAMRRLNRVRDFLKGGGHY